MVEYICDVCHAEFPSKRSLASHRGHCFSIAKRFVPLDDPDVSQFFNKPLLVSHRESQPRKDLVGGEECFDYHGLFQVGGDGGDGDDDAGDDDDEDTDEEAKREGHEEEQEDEDNENASDGEAEAMLNRPIEELARLYKKADLPQVDDPQMKYYIEQVAFGDEMFGNKAMQTKTWSDFKYEVRADTRTKLSNIELKRFELLQFGTKLNISRDNGDSLLHIINDYKDPDKKLVKSWRTMLRLGEKLLENEEILRMRLGFPAAWKMTLFPNCSVRFITLIARDPLFLVARQFMDPKLMYGYGEHMRYKAFKEENSQGERLHGPIMGTVHAEKTEEAILERDNKATILPFIFNSDGVALGKTNQQMTTVMFANGLMDDFLLEQPISKQCLGYLPKLPYSEAELEDHLVSRAGYASKAVAKDAITAFKITMQNSYWAMVLEPIIRHHKHGVYMRLLNTPDHAIRVYPYFYTFVGDEPGIKGTYGYLMGGAKRFCMCCLYRNQDGAYDERRHKKRKFDSIQALCIKAERSLKRRIGDPKNKDVRRNREDDAARKKLWEHGIYPMTNPFQDAPMGYRNSIRFPAYDTLHTLAGGMVKNLCYFVISLVMSMSRYNQKGKFDDIKGILDERMRSFPHLPAMKHTPSKYFRRGVTFLVGGDSADERSGAAHSMAKMTTMDFVMLAFQLYFGIDENGLILPNTDAYEYKRTRMEKIANKKTKTTTVIPCENITKQVLSTITAVLSLFYECKRTHHTDQSLTEMKALIISVQARYLNLWELHHKIVSDKDPTFAMRKLHYISHFPEHISRFGSLLHTDTGSYETAHKSYTTGVWDMTSKRMSSQYEEMSKSMLLQSTIIALDCIRAIKIDDIRTFRPKLSPEYMSYRRIGGKKASVCSLLIKSLTHVTPEGTEEVKYEIKVKSKTTKDAMLFKEYATHNSLKMQSTKSIVRLLRSGGIDIEALIHDNAQLNILQGLKYEANIESGLGEGFIYATNNFNGTGKSRHDFISLQLEDGEGIEYQQLAIVLVCLQSYCEGKSSKFYMIVQTLEKVIEKRGDVPVYRPPHFTLWKWEQEITDENGKLQYQGKSLYCFSTAAIAEVACVIPRFKKASKRQVESQSSTGGSISTSKDDRFWYVNRKFMDRSGWEDGLEVQWGNDEERNLLQAMLQVQLPVHDGQQEQPEERELDYELNVNDEDAESDNEEQAIVDHEDRRDDYDLDLMI